MNNFVAVGVLLVRGEVVGGEEDGAHAGVAILHLVPQREAVHRLQEDLGNQQVQVLAVHHRDGILAGVRGFDLVARGGFQDIQHRPEVILAIDD